MANPRNRKIELTQQRLGPRRLNNVACAYQHRSYDIEECKPMTPTNQSRYTFAV